MQFFMAIAEKRIKNVKASNLLPPITLTNVGALILVLKIDASYSMAFSLKSVFHLGLPMATTY